ncbi:MAG: hypothetical protein Q9P44_19535 [Anaerolineae bacterium]|nr:hypothetical protein [Anaerolineae bacterium]
MLDVPKTFMDYVQFHERVWGNEQYPNRPQLQEILDASVVVFWQDIGMENLQNRRFQVTLHDQLDEVEVFISKALQRSHNDYLEKRIHRVYKNSVRVNIKHIRIEFEESDSQETLVHKKEDDDNGA